MKNRDITKDEINKITERCQPRERAFFTIMRQSGLPPHIIKQLKIKNLEPNTPIPCKISLPHEQFPTFIGEDSINHLKQYLATRTNLTPESLLFTIRDNPNKQINTKNVSRAFALAAQKLQKEGKISYKIESRKPSKLRLYNLIKFYRKNAKYYLIAITQKPDNNTLKIDEYYRKLYEEKAMPSLDIETPDIRQLKKQIEKRDDEITEIKESIRKLQPIINLFENADFNDPETLQRIFIPIKTARPIKIDGKETMGILEVTPDVDRLFTQLAEQYNISKNEIVTRIQEWIQQNKEKQNR
jgi:hypothetical protein